MPFPDVTTLLLGKIHVVGALLRRPFLSEKRAVRKSCCVLHKVATCTCLEAGRVQGTQSSPDLFLCVTDGSVTALLWLSSEGEILALC